MKRSPESLLRMTLAIPRVGEATSIKKGPLELRLEHHHGGLCLLTPHSRAPKRHFLGLPPDGWLELAVRAPDYRIRVHLRDRLTLVSGGRLRGYVTVPLPHRLSWCSDSGRCGKIGRAHV